jgi:hypothetical protein
MLKIVCFAMLNNFQLYDGGQFLLVEERTFYMCILLMMIDEQVRTDAGWR